MGKTLRFGSKGNRVALQDRINRMVIHRIRNEQYRHDILSDLEGKKVAFEVSPGQRLQTPNYVSYRTSAPGFGRRLPPR